ncbi:hypothetical protein [Subtercola sp. Z020]|uniref:hypothetical protein n=1 Tax=Subtercola sp. Z020 TaxID=2080582 RepID=UPI0011B0559C|nr:hypothetical protein [Subtercola sp. Z020]
MTAWIRAATKDTPGSIRAGYRLNGKALVGYGDPAFTAPFAAAAAVDAGSQPWLNALWPRFAAPSGGYFADSIALQSMLLISNNTWLP